MPTDGSRIVLRRLTIDDWELWREIRLRALAEAPGAFGSTLASWQGEGDVEGRWRARLEDVPLNVAAFDAQRAVGQVSGTTVDADGRSELISLWVDPAARGMGVGEALLREVIDWAAGQGAGAVVLSVKRTNAPAIALYERVGFVRSDAPAQDPTEMPMLYVHLR